MLKIGDVEDPDIYLGAVAHVWMQTEHGAWCKEHSLELTYQQSIDHNSFSYVYAIYASFKDADAFLYKLKWGDT